MSSHQRKLLRQRALRMRHEPSRGEWVLWQALRGSQLGVVFRRQVVLQGYIADFYACSVRLVVEVDGGWHAGRSRADARRDRALSAAGYRVLRAGEQDVLTALPQVMARIRAAIEQPRPQIPAPSAHSPARCAAAAPPPAAPSAQFP